MCVCLLLAVVYMCVCLFVCLFTSLTEPEVFHGALIMSSVHQLFLGVVSDQSLYDGVPLRLVDEQVVDSC